MSYSYSKDPRVRVISGELSNHKAAEPYDIGVAMASRRYRRYCNFGGDSGVQTTATGASSFTVTLALFLRLVENKPDIALHAIGGVP